MRLFVYGELCKVAVLYRLLGRVPPARGALLTDHRRRRGEHGFFVVEPAAGARVAGLLLSGLESRDMERLDEFERTDNGLYRRVRVRVRTLGTDPEDVAAEAYLAPGPGVDSHAPEPGS